MRGDQRQNTFRSNPKGSFPKSIDPTCHRMSNGIPRGKVPPPTPPMYKEKLKRCGVALIIVGILDVAYMAWCIISSQSCHTTFNIFGIIAGIFLIRGSLKAAKWTAYFGSFFLVMGIVGLLVSCLAFPIGYTVASWKFQAHTLIYNVAMAILSVPLIFWICKELLSPEVIDAQKTAKIKPANIKRPVIVGAIISIAMGGILFKVTRGETADKAIQLAKMKFGGDYRYQVTNLGINTNVDPKGVSVKTVSALVAVYNDSEFKTVPVSWTE